jgi:hypothetical protein
MKLSAIIKGSICLLGFAGVGNLLAAPASADQAAARAATSITTPSSFTQSVSGEVLLPGGLFFGGTEQVGTAAVAEFVGDTEPVTGVDADSDGDFDDLGDTEPVTGVDANGDGDFDDAPVIGSAASADYMPASSLTVLPTTSTTGGATQIDDLSLNAGEATSVSTVDGAGKISDVVAAILEGTNSNVPEEEIITLEVVENTAVNAKSIDDAAAIIKAAAGVNGLD